ncbi:hypothetical protein HYC85_006081 [Camellia sinensis]|uniref:Uncharacterized protein n=1 Tax=Camellia sinensis TaxID=4442 RepID=A0A7J7I322_CAMSI|nr:hypothetical protein HYC85_006081 [Camellia sinensis]
MVGLGWLGNRLRLHMVLLHVASPKRRKAKKTRTPENGKEEKRCKRHISHFFGQKVIL